MYFNNQDQVDESSKKITTVYVDFRSNEFVAVDPNYDHLKAVLKPELSELVPKEKDIAILKRRENVGPIYVWTNEDKELESSNTHKRLRFMGNFIWLFIFGFGPELSEWYLNIMITKRHRDWVVK